MFCEKYLLLYFKQTISKNSINVCNLKYIGTTTSPYIEQNVWSSEQGALTNNNTLGGQSPSRDLKSQDQKPSTLHINQSHPTTGPGEGMKNGDRSPTTLSTSDLQHEQLTSNMSSMSISPSSSSPVRKQGINYLLL